MDNLIISIIMKKITFYFIVSNSELEDEKEG